MAYEFKVIDHLKMPGKQAIECWRDGKFVAGIYPHEDGIRVVSKFMTDVSKEPESALARAPSAIIKLGKTPVV